MATNRDPMSGDYPGRTTRYPDASQRVWGALLPDWRELDRQRIKDREARGLPVYRLSWCCDHLEHDPTSVRGPVRLSQQRWKEHQQFVLRDRERDE